jgi:hypothetical protein
MTSSAKASSNAISSIVPMLSGVFVPASGPLAGNPGVGSTNYVVDEDNIDDQ